MKGARQPGDVDDDAPTDLFVRPSAFAGASLWDANDVARYLKVSRSWVYQRAEARLMPCVRVGGLLRFDPAAVRRFAETGQTPRPNAEICSSRVGKIR